MPVQSKIVPIKMNSNYLNYINYFYSYTNFTNMNQLIEPNYTSVLLAEEDEDNILLFKEAVFACNCSYYFQWLRFN